MNEDEKTLTKFATIGAVALGALALWRTRPKEKVGELPEVETPIVKRVETILLDNARTDRAFYWSGKSLRVILMDGTDASIKLNSVENESRDLTTVKEIREIFDRFYLTNTAQAGKKLRIEIEILMDKWKSAMEFLVEKMMLDPYQETPKMGGERNVTHGGGNVTATDTVPSGKVWKVFAGSVADVTTGIDVDLDVDNGLGGVNFMVVTLASTLGGAQGQVMWSGEIYLSEGMNIKAHWYNAVAGDILHWGFAYVEKDVS